MYQVKWTDKTGKVKYGIHREYDEKAGAFAKKGLAIVDDAILPECYLVPIKDLIEIPCIWQGEFHLFVEAEEKKATEASDKLKGCVPGKLFGVGVGDGSAWYIVTKVNKKTVKIEWRGFCPDRYVDRRFGMGGSFPKDQVEMFCASIF